MNGDNAFDATLDEAAAASLAPAPGRRTAWHEALELMTRPQPVTVPMVALFALIPFYLYIGELVRGGPLHVPELALDRAIPVVPAWSVVYGSLFLAALLPVMVVHQQELIRRTILAFLMAWLVSYAVFLAYPTVTSRPEEFAGDGFFDWTLRIIYESDIRYNCFPSLHVAQCFIAALVCHRVHPGVGAVAGVWAFFVALSTLFTKQHYALDVLGGMFLAGAAWLAFLRGYPRDAVPERERRLAPALALGAVGMYALAVIGLWLAHTLKGS
jgi:membrane-associated phospholipid phosphatase